MATVESRPRYFSQRLADAKMMLDADVHLGTKNADPQMKQYIFECRDDGIYIINLIKTWHMLQLAAREIVAIENPQNIIVRSASPYGQRAVLKFAQYTGAHAIAPGSFTNQLHTSFGEPRLLILTDPRTDHQHIEEAALANIRTIAFCDTDSPMRYVDIVIPANIKGKHSIECLFWLLARMVLQMRGTIPPGLKWEVMVDLSFYIEPEQAKQPKEDEIAAPDSAIADFNASAIGGDILCPVVIDQPCTDVVPVNSAAPKTAAAGDCGEAVPPPQLGLDNGRVWAGSGPNQQTIPIRRWKKQTQIRPSLGFGLCGCWFRFMRLYGSVQRVGRIRKTVFAKRRHTAKKRRMKMNKNGPQLMLY